MRYVKLALLMAALGIATALAPPPTQAKEVRIVMGASGDGALQRGMHLFAKNIVFNHFKSYQVCSIVCG